MKKRLFVLGACCSAMILSQSVFFGAVGDPGTAEDPLISESYFSKIVNPIKTDVNNLKSSQSSQDAKIKALEDKIASLSSGGTSSGLSQQDVNILLHFSGMNPQNKHAATKRGNVNLKEQPNESSKTLDVLPFYAGVIPVDAQDGYIKVKYFSKVGWIQYKDLEPHFLKK